jgi:hypothetical protein
MESICRERPNLRSSKCSFSYIKADEYESEKPYYYSAPLPAEEEHLRTNLKYSTVDDITVVDVRDVRDQISLDKQGFEYFDAPANLTYAALAEKGLEVYLKDATSFLRFRLNAQLILVYDYRVRGTSGFPSSENPYQDF